jgi:hypothetical protein
MSSKPTPGESLPICPSLGRNRQFAEHARHSETSRLLFQSARDIQVRKNPVVGIYVGLTVGCNVNRQEAP